MQKHNGTQQVSKLKQMVRDGYRRYQSHDKNCPDHFYLIQCSGMSTPNISFILREVTEHSQSKDDYAQIYLNLHKNKLQLSRCQTLVKASIDNLFFLNLSDNNLEDWGCYCLTKGKWPVLQHLDLAKNNVKQKGCKYLTKSNWNSIKNIYLNFNPIGKEGYRYLLGRFHKPGIFCDYQYR